jgi:hypothetical protein
LKYHRNISTISACAAITPTPHYFPLLDTKSDIQNILPPSRIFRISGRRSAAKHRNFTTKTPFFSSAPYTWTSETQQKRTHPEPRHDAFEVFFVLYPQTLLQNNNNYSHISFFVVLKPNIIIIIILIII